MSRRKNNPEVVDIEEYSGKILIKKDSLPDIAKPLLQGAKAAFKEIEKRLYTAPSIISVVQASFPKEILQAAFTDEQMKQLADGVVKLMTKKDGSLLAQLVNPETKKMVSQVTLKSVKMAPELAQAMTSYATQMQLMQIAEQIEVVQKAIEEVRLGQEYDRLATAYSCQQKLLQAMEIKNPELRTSALLRIALDAEDSRNLLMQSQKANVAFISDQPESIWKKLISGIQSDKINERMTEIRESFRAVNIVSLAEAIAYQKMGEDAAAQKSLRYYADFIQETYLSHEGLVDRLDMLDPSPKNYWTKKLPEVEKTIQELPGCEEMGRMGE